MVSFWIKRRIFFFFFSSRRRHTRLVSDWSSDVCSSDLLRALSREVRRDTRVAALSLAMLSPLRSTCLALAMAGFIPNERVAPLLVKPHKAIEGLPDRSQWRETCLEDVDVW